MPNLNEIIESLRGEMTETLARWVKIPSVTGEPAPGAPFGEEIRRCLETALADAEKMGFTVRNFDGYAGDVRMGPEGVDPQDEETRNALIAPVAHYLRNTRTRVPFSDWYDTITGAYIHFIARSVQGGIYMPMLKKQWEK